MKRLTFCILILAGMAALLLAQQSRKSNVTTDAAGSPSDRLSDDDGGVVQIVAPDAPSVIQKKARVAPVMKSVRQVSIFLGTAWAEQSARSRERVLSDLVERLGELQNNKVTVLPAAPLVEDFTDLTNAPMNDLGIQRKLNEMLVNKAIPSPDSATIYIVFLAPGIKSSVGGHTGGVDYAAYHSSVHVEAGEVRYVVVPFDENAERQIGAASQALIQTAFNPVN